MGQPGPVTGSSHEGREGRVPRHDVLRVGRVPRPGKSARFKGLMFRSRQGPRQGSGQDVRSRAKLRPWPSRGRDMVSVGRPS